MVSLARGVFAEVPEREVFVDHLARKVTMGAMGVDKIKDLPDGQVQVLLRFICIMSPQNAHMRKLRGDAHLLPSVGKLCLTMLEQGEVLLVDNEDMLSCFN